MEDETCEWCSRDIPDDAAYWETDGHIFCSEECSELWQEQEELLNGPLEV